jgi:hypothetical protein
MQRGSSVTAVVPSAVLGQPAARPRVAPTVDPKTPIEQLPQYLTVDEVAQYLRVGRTAAYDFARGCTARRLGASFASGEKLSGHDARQRPDAATFRRAQGERLPYPATRCRLGAGVVSKPQGRTAEPLR